MFSKEFKRSNFVENMAKEFYLSKINYVVSEAATKKEIHSVWELRNWNRDFETLKRNATFCVDVGSGINLRLFLKDMETTVLENDVEVKTKYLSLYGTAYHLMKTPFAVKLKVKVGHLQNLKFGEPTASQQCYQFDHRYLNEFRLPTYFSVIEINNKEATVIDKFIPIAKITGCNTAFPSTEHFKQPDSFWFGISVLLISVTQSEIPHKQNTVNNSLQRDLMLMQQEKDNFSDLQLETSDKIRVDVHKFVLAARSQVLRAKIEKEMKTNTLNGVLIVDMNSKTLEQILKWVYSGEMSETDEDLLESILDAAVKYELEDLLISLDKKLIKICKVSNMLQLMLTAQKYKLANAFKDISQFIKEHVDKMVL